MELFEQVKESRVKFLMLPHPLINFETQKNYQNETRFNGVYSRINIPKLKESGIYNKS